MRLRPTGRYDGSMFAADSIANFASLLPVITTGTSLLVVLFAWRQTVTASVLVQASAQAEESRAVMFFTDHFLELCRGRDPGELISDKEWADRYWNLLGTEFYFFQTGVVPEFIFSIWMTFLADLYVVDDGLTAWKSHEAYLDIYAERYQGLYDFYTELHQASISIPHPTIRANEVAAVVSRWSANNLGGGAPPRRAKSISGRLRFMGPKAQRRGCS